MPEERDKPRIGSEEPGSKRDPEDRPAESRDTVREKMLDKRLADSFPTSDPPSTIPDPSQDCIDTSDEQAA